MAALSRLIAKELSSALGITDNPKFNPMFKQTDEALSDVEDPNTSTIAEFYSPLESAIENAPIGKKGTRGENIEAFVRKRAPKVTQAELDYREFSLYPHLEYTKGLAKLHANPLRIKAVKKRTANQNMQRQKDLLDEEVGYEEIGVDVIAKDLGLMTHYGGSNLAHARYSLRKKPDTFKEVMLRGEDIKSYILIEELQSDVIQNMSKNPTKDSKELLDTFKKEFDLQMDDIAFEPEFELPGTFFKDYKDFVFNDYLPIVTNKKLSRKEVNESLSKIFDDKGLLMSKTGIYYQEPTEALRYMLNRMAAKKLNVFDFSGRERIISEIIQSTRNYTAKFGSIVSKKDTPITSLTDSVRVLLQSIIADSKAKGIDEIVLPPIEKLAEKRFPKGSDDYKKAITKGSGFHNTYVIAFEKAIKQLKGELGNQIKIGKKDLKYKTFERIKTYDEIVEQNKTGKKGFPETTVQGTSINIKDLKLDATKVKLRLNKGGLVQRPDR